MEFVRFCRPIVAPLFPLFPPRVVLFVVFFAWYLWAVVDTRLVFQARDMLFLWNIHYFTDFLDQPGSLLEWTHNLLVQLCYWGWPGAIAVAAAAWLLFVSTIGLMHTLGGARIGGTWVVPGVLLVMLFSGYLFPTSAIVGLALAMTAANLWCRLPLRGTWLRVALFMAVSAVVYYVVGVGVAVVLPPRGDSATVAPSDVTRLLPAAYWCFAACCIIHEALTRRRWFSGALFLLAAVGVKYGLDAVLARFNLASHNYHVLSQARRQLNPLDWRETALYVYFPACALFAALRQPALALSRVVWRRISRREGKALPSQSGRETGENRGQSVGAGGLPTWTGRAIRWTATTVLVLLLAATAAYYSFDGPDKLLREIDYCSEHQRWDEVLAKAEKLPPEAYSLYVANDVNLALYHTGRLPYHMFSYPQRYRVPALLTAEQVGGEMLTLRKPLGLLLELGRVNEAERVALEMLETMPRARRSNGWR